MSNSQHLLLLACVQALALSCASRSEPPRPQPMTAVMPHWLGDSELRSTRPGAAASLANPYAPTRSHGARVYSWQSEKRAECGPGVAAAKPELERGSTRALLAAMPERSSDPSGKVQPLSPDFVVAGLRPAIHHCFSRWLDAKLDAQGSVRLALELGCAGDVQAISAENQGVDESTLTCLFSVVAPARFAPPVGGRATVLVPVVFKNAAR